MNILRVAQKIYPDVKGGGPYHVHAMSRDQAAMGHDVTVVTVRSDPSLPGVEERDGYTVVRHDPTVELLGNEVSSGVAEHLRWAGDFDVIHAHSHLYFSTNLAALKRFFDGTPLAITNHGLYSQTAPEWVFDRYLQTVGRWTFNQADAVFCYTDVDKRRLREFGVRSRIEVVPNGVDTERFTPEGPESDRLDADGPAALFVGRLVEGKRPQDVLEAASIVRESRPDLTLYLCGEGPLREELEAGAGEELGDGVVFLGHVSYDEMPKIYRSADVLVLPSRAEGVPRTVLEALASGTRVITSDLPHVDEVLPDGERTVPVGDVPRLADALDATLAETDAHGAAEARLQHATDWSHTSERTTAVLSQLHRENVPSYHDHASTTK
ncbi:glycosyltransferase family 4 protein [Haloferacaceae archaeon DSL9]